MIITSKVYAQTMNWYSVTQVSLLSYYYEYDIIIDRMDGLYVGVAPKD